MTEVLDYQRADTWHVTTSQEPLEPRSQTEPQEPLVVAQASGNAGSARTGEEWVEGLPLGLVQAYAERAALHARVREVDPGVWVASVVGLEGAYGDGDSEAEACDDLREAVVGWVAVRRRLGLDIPELEGLDLNVPPVRRTPA